MRKLSPWSLGALKITVFYFILGFTWIFFSDMVLEFFVNDINILSEIQTYKGWFYILATALLLFILIRNKLKAVDSAETRILEQGSALKESQKVYSRLFETITQGVIYQAANGEIIAANPTAERILGLTPDELKRRTSHDPEWRAIREDGSDYPGDEHPSMLALKTGKTQNDVVMGIYNPEKDQTTWIKIQAVPEFRNGDTKPYQVFTTFEDVSEQKLAGIENERLARQHQLALNASKLGWWHYDPISKISTYDERYKEVFGVTGSKRPNDEILELLHPDDLPNVWKKVEAALDPVDPKAYEAEYRINRPDGEQRWIEAFGLAEFSGEGANRRAIGFAGTIADITERKRDETRKRIMIDLLKLLSSAEDKTETIHAVLTYLKRWSGCEAVGIRIKEDEDYPYFETSGFSESFVRLENSLCAYDANGDIERDENGEPLLECMCGNIIRGRFDPDQSFFTTDGSFWSNCTTELLVSTTDEDRQARTRNRCNGVGYESVALIPLRSGNQTFGLIQFNDKRRGRFTRDLIAQFRWAADNLAHFLARSQAEDDNKRLEAQLHQAMRLEAIGRLAGGVAHDFNNLLTAISGNVALSMLDLREDTQLYQNLSEVGDAAQRAASLTRQLLAFSRKQIIEPRVIDMNRIVRELEQMLNRLIGEDIDILWVLDPSNCKVKVDPGQIEQVIINLCVNARDAMPTGGRLTIETDVVELDDAYLRKHPNMLAGHYVMVAVSDNGEGMDEQTRAHIFEPFFTTKSMEEGTGLGLATSFGIVKQHGGHIEVYSEPGEGSTFKVYLPQVEESLSHRSLSSQNEDLPGGRETILVVEDEQSVRKIAVRLLDRLGYTILEAHNADEALTYNNGSGRSIDLLLTDVVLPGMNGRELAQKLTESSPQLKVLYTSGYTENVIAHHGVLDEGILFIGKPYSPKNLAFKVREVLDS